METLLKELAEQININLNNEEISMFRNYMELLVEKNKVMNLTAITNENEIVLKHFIDSLSINKYISPNSLLIDVGTGAGFPGIPIKIIRKDMKITLLDSLNKRLVFLNEVINNLKLKDINTVHGRAEDIAHDIKFREKFDFVTARAVANLSTLSELCMPFLKVGGKFICMKGNSIEEVGNAQNAIKTLGGKIISIDKISLPNSDIERNIIIIEKFKNTPIKYPRKAGIPSREPIL